MADDLPVAVFADDHPGDLHGQRRSIDDKMRGAGHVDGLIQPGPGEFDVAELAGVAGERKSLEPVPR